MRYIQRSSLIYHYLIDIWQSPEPSKAQSSIIAPTPPLSDFRLKDRPTMRSILLSPDTLDSESAEKLSPSLRDIQVALFEKSEIADDVPNAAHNEPPKPMETTVDRNDTVVTSTHRILRTRQPRVGVPPLPSRKPAQVPISKPKPEVPQISAPSEDDHPLRSRSRVKPEEAPKLLKVASLCLFHLCVTQLITPS